MFTRDLGRSVSVLFFYVPTGDSGVEDIAVEGNEEIIGIYNLAGHPVENPGSGLYIVKTNRGSHKMLIK